MGNSRSIHSHINTQNELVTTIHGIAHDLTERYQRDFLDPTFCNRVALIYNDKLLSYRKQTLENVAVTLGLAVDMPAYKSKLCESIVKHYTNRINLIAAIVSSLSHCNNRIRAVTTGPQCVGNPEVFTSEECTGGVWTEKIVPPDDSLEENKLWYQYVNGMQEQYIMAMARLKEILETLRDFDNDIDDERLHVLGEEVRGLIEKMQGQCTNLYNLVLVTPTATIDDVRHKRERQRIDGQEADARKAALRASRGLATVRGRE